MFFKEVIKDILRKQAHDFAEVFGEMHLTNVAHHVGQAVLGDIGLTLGNQGLQGLAVGISKTKPRKWCLNNVKELFFVFLED